MMDNLIGKSFGKLTPISKSQNINGRTAWLCNCSCGNQKIVKSESLKDGSTKSCGCLNNEKRSERAKLFKTRKYPQEISIAKRIHKKYYSDGNLTFEDFYSMSQLNCYYCNSIPINKQFSFSKKSSELTKTIPFIYNGLDRIDNSKPHDKENLITCCKYCNYAKRERSIEEFYYWIENLYNNIKEINETKI